MDKNILNKFWCSIRRDRVGPVLLWNLPLAMVLIIYKLAVFKLMFLQYAGFTFAHWNSDTEIVVQATHWFYSHPWIFLLIGMMSNTIFLFSSRRKPFVYGRWIFFAVFVMGVLWYCYLGAYMVGKLLM